MRLLRHIELKGNPSTVTAQQKGCRVHNGKAYHYTKSKVRTAERELMAELYPFRPSEPYRSELCLRVIWRFSRKAWESKKQRTSYKGTKPDLDNLVKGLADVMTGLFWYDDNQLARLELSKIWNEEGGLVVEVLELTAEDYEKELEYFNEEGKE